MYSLVAPQSSAEVPLPCPDWPYLPCLALWTTFRAHRPPPPSAVGLCQKPFPLLKIASWVLYGQYPKRFYWLFRTCYPAQDLPSSHIGLLWAGRREVARCLEVCIFRGSQIPPKYSHSCVLTFAATEGATMHLVRSMYRKFLAYQLRTCKFPYKRLFYVVSLQAERSSKRSFNGVTA